MIIPELKEFNIISEDWVDEQEFWIMVQAGIGEQGEDGSDVFTYYVTSPKRLSRILEAENVQIGRGLLIMSDFDINKVRTTIEQLIKNCKRETWEEVAVSISRYAYWEFEDYEE